MLFIYLLISLWGTIFTWKVAGYKIWITTRRASQPSRSQNRTFSIDKVCTLSECIRVAQHRLKQSHFIRVQATKTYSIWNHMLWISIGFLFMFFFPGVCRLFIVSIHDFFFFDVSVNIFQWIYTPSASSSHLVNFAYQSIDSFSA